MTRLISRLRRGGNGDVDPQNAQGKYMYQKSATELKM